MRTKTLLGACLLSASLIPQLQAADPSDKSQYDLFHPTPADLMRPMVSDVATFAYSPFTVDAGHFQIDADVVDYVYDHDRSGGGDVKFDGWVFGLMVLRAGLCNRAELQVGFKAYSDFVSQDRVTGVNTGARGFGNVTSSLKINVWGNDSGNTALAILPYVTFPTSQVSPDPDYSGGIEIPFSAKLPWDFTLGLETGFTLAKNAANKIRPTFLNGINLRHPIAGKLSAYAEFFTFVDDNSGTWSGDVVGGLVYQATKNLQLIAGFVYGAHNDTDYNPYLSFAWRF